jgi:hypothetical protein
MILAFYELCGCIGYLVKKGKLLKKVKKNRPKNLF